MRGYIASVYEAVAGANPDYIWIDDDVRLYGHMPIGACCFCDTCMQKFSKSSGKEYTRQSLRTAFNAEPLPDQLALRKSYLQHNRGAISDLFRLIEKTVHAKSPGMPLGFMTGDRFFEGYDFDTWAGILAGPGRRRNGRQSFWKCPTYLFEPAADGAQAISRCVNYTYNETAPCCTGVFENREGGRVCAAGYYPYEQLQNLSKSAQLKSVMRWLSKDTLPAYVSSFHRINLWVRRPQGHIAIALLNASLDPAANVELLVRTEKTQMSIAIEGGKSSATAISADGPYQRFVMPIVQPWEVALAVV